MALRSTKDLKKIVAKARLNSLMRTQQAGGMFAHMQETTNVSQNDEDEMQEEDTNSMGKRPSFIMATFGHERLSPMNNTQ